MNKLEIHSGLELFYAPLDIQKLHTQWLIQASKLNFGAFVSFVGIVREEDGIEALFFEIFEPLLRNWFKEWEEKVQNNNSLLFMAHSIGKVEVKESSFFAAIASRKRRYALEMIDLFVEDFKKNAPIWKYDIKDGKKIYAKDRSQSIDGSGLLCLNNI